MRSRNCPNRIDSCDSEVLACRAIVMRPGGLWQPSPVGDLRSVPWMASSRFGAFVNLPQERQQVGVDLILMRGGKSVRCSRIIDFLRALDEFGRFFGRVMDGNDLVVF